MAGPSIGTWVKVRSKSGGTTPRVLAKKFGGGAYQQGQVITQSEYNSYKKDRAEAKKAETSASSGSGSGDRRQARQARIAEIRSNIDNAARERFNSIRADQKKKGQRDTKAAYARLDRTKVGKRSEALSRRLIQQERAEKRATSTGSGNRANRRAAMPQSERRKGEIRARGGSTAQRLKEMELKQRKEFRRQSSSGRGTRSIGRAWENRRSGGQ